MILFPLLPVYLISNDPVVIGRVIDRVIVPALEDGDTDLAALVGAGVAIVAVAVGRSAGVIGRRYFGNMAAKRFQDHGNHRDTSMVRLTSL